MSNYSENELSTFSQLLAVLAAGNLEISKAFFAKLNPIEISRFHQFRKDNRLYTNNAQKALT